MDIERRGQALMELAVGMFALALVVSALCGFAQYIVKSLRVQNELRTSGDSNERSDQVSYEGLAAEYVFGCTSLKIEESVIMPERSILK